jgi:hypothetical protein
MAEESLLLLYFKKRKHFTASDVVRSIERLLRHGAATGLFKGDEPRVRNCANVARAPQRAAAAPVARLASAPATGFLQTQACLLERQATASQKRKNTRFGVADQLQQKSQGVSLAFSFRLAGIAHALPRRFLRYFRTISTRRFCGSRTPGAVGTRGLLSP